MAATNVIDIENRLRIASASLRRYKRLDSETGRNAIEIRFWTEKIDALLDAKLNVRQPISA